LSLATDIRLVRIRAKRHLSAEIASAAGLSLGELRSVIDGRLPLAPWQASALAIRIALAEKPLPPDRLTPVEIDRLRALLRTYPRRKQAALAERIDLGIHALTLFISGDGMLTPPALRALAAAIGGTP
jgi:hypothetical protein